MQNNNTSDNIAVPHISVQTQYVKDFSFENPNAPGIFLQNQKAPEIDLTLDLSVNPLPEENYYEVEIYINAHASCEGDTLFLVDLKYAGVFHLINIPSEQMEVLLAIHCPSIIFPYARKIIGDATQNGGFQPLLIDPVDFGALYAKKMSEKQNGNNELQG